MSTLTRNSFLALALLVVGSVTSWAKPLTEGGVLSNKKPKALVEAAPVAPYATYKVLKCGYELSPSDEGLYVGLIAENCNSGTVHWYNSSNNSEIGTGVYLENRITSNTSYYAKCEESSVYSLPSASVNIPYAKIPPRPQVYSVNTGSFSYYETCQNQAREAVRLASTVTDPSFDYVWDRDGMNGVTSANTKGQGTPQIEIDLTGRYSVKAISRNCPTPAGVQYSSNNIFVLFIEIQKQPVITGDSLFCQGKVVSLKSDSATHVAYYKWYVNGVYQDSLGNKSSIKFNKTAKIQVQTIENRQACYSKLSNPISLKALNVPAKPTITPSKKNAGICNGDTLTLTSSLGYKYKWNTGATTASLKGINAVGKYAVQVIDTSGCVSPTSDTTIVKVYAIPAKPTISSDGPLAFCDGFSVNLTSSTQSKYAWSSGEITKSIKVTKAGSYTVAVRDTNNCLSPTSDAIRVTVYALPAKPTITVKGDGLVKVCADRSIVLESSVLASGETTRFRWTTNDTTRSVTVKVTTKAAVRVVDPRGCVSPLSDTIAVTVLPLPAAPVVTAEGAITFCSRDVTDYTKENSVRLTASSSNDVTWNTGLVSKVLDAVKLSGQYSATAKDANGCVSARSNVITVTVKESPSASAASIVKDGAFTLKATNFPDGTDYQWKYGSEVLTFVEESIKANRYGDYSARRKVVYSVPAPLNTLVCYTDYSKAYTFKEEPELKGLAIYPNPSNGLVTVETLENYNKVSFSIYDMIGRLIYTGSIPTITGKVVVDLRNQPEGPYLFRFQADGFELTKRLVVNR